MQKQQGKQLKHKKINFKSINWENLLLWSLLIVSFILAIVAISKSGKQGPAGRDGRDGGSGFVKPDDKQLNELRTEILSDVDTIIFKNNAGKIRSDQGNIDMDLGDKYFSINGEAGKALFHFKNGTEDEDHDFFRVQECNNNNYFYVNKDSCSNFGCNTTEGSGSQACLTENK